MIEIISSIFSNKTRNQLHKESWEKITNLWKLNNTLLNNYGLKEVKVEFKKYQKTSENEIVVPKSMRYSISGTKRKVYSYTDIPHETRSQQSNLTPKGTRKRTTTNNKKPRVTRRRK